MGLIESLETAIATSRRNYAELVSLTDQLITEQQQQGQRNWLRLNAKPWTVATLKKTFASFAAARAYFGKCYGLKARGWKTLAEQVNTVETALIHLGLAIRENPQEKSISPFKN
ncbi:MULTISPECIES: hypothetical protein [unclassified Synechococcus]|jgi:hypothetical protein|uniref:hypothetical protein n=1 Tax=unclassified Synechococcus TaxID=2626047 RepID=UPI0039C4070D